MSFKAPSAPLPAVPAAPANPPMFGENAPKKKAGGGTPQQFSSTVLGAPPAQQNLASKTLLGQ